MILFDNFDFSDFWYDSDYAQKSYTEAQPSDELVIEIEKELGYKLPASYIWLMKRRNGGLSQRTVFPRPDTVGYPVYIDGIKGIGRKKECSLCGKFGSQFWIDEWGYPAIGVAICDCPSAGHDMIFLDYRECGPQGEPKVVHIDQENNYEITPMSDTFEEFIQGLVEDAETNKPAKNTLAYKKTPQKRNVKGASIALIAGGCIFFLVGLGCMLFGIDKPEHFAGSLCMIIGAAFCFGGAIWLAIVNDKQRRKK